MIKTEWVICPICRNKTRLKICEDTELKNFLLFCPKCKEETLITIGMVPCFFNIHKGFSLFLDALTIFWLSPFVIRVIDLYHILFNTVCYNELR